MSVCFFPLDSVTADRIRKEADMNVGLDKHIGFIPGYHARGATSVT